MADTTNENTMDLIYIDPRNIIIKSIEENPREDYGDLDNLAQSILNRGLSVPIKVSIGEIVDGVQMYDLVHGYRRTSAIQQVILADNPDWDQMIPALLVDYTQEEILVAHLTDNSGKPLNPLEQAEIFRRLHKDCGHDMNTVASICKCSYSSVSQLMKLAEAPTELKDLIRNDQISPSLATRMLLEHSNNGVPEYDKIIGVFNEILNGKIKSPGKKGKITKADLTATSLAKVSKIGSKIQKAIKTMKADQILDEYVDNAAEMIDFIEKINTLDGEALQEHLCSFKLVKVEEPPEVEI